MSITLPFWLIYIAEVGIFELFGAIVANSEDTYLLFGVLLVYVLAIGVAMNNTTLSDNILYGGAGLSVVVALLSYFQVEENKATITPLLYYTGLAFACGLVVIGASALLSTVTQKEPTQTEQPRYALIKV